jgi:hypothetical protein
MSGDEILIVSLIYDHRNITRRHLAHDYPELIKHRRRYSIISIIMS